jgi:hypothetical protein
MLIRRFVHITMVMVIMSMLILYASPAFAEDELDGKPETMRPLPEGDKIGICELENVLDPSSPHYDPSQRYGPEGTRFGPPGKRIDAAPTFETEQRILIDLNQDYYGTYIYSGNGIVRVQANQKIDTGITLDESGDALYTSLLAPDYCRLESVASYFKNGSTMERYWKAYDHYNDCFIVATPMNSSFVSRYTSGGYVCTTIAKTGDVPLWSIYLYDYIDNEWDYFAGAYGNGDHSYGWDIWEGWNLWNTWPSLPQIRSYNLLRFQTVNGQGYLIEYPYGYVFSQRHNGFPYSYGYNYQWYDWYVGPGG